MTPFSRSKRIQSASCWSGMAFCWRRFQSLACSSKMVFFSAPGWRATACTSRVSQAAGVDRHGLHQRHRHGDRPVIGGKEVIQILRKPGFALRLGIGRAKRLRAVFTCGPRMACTAWRRSRVKRVRVWLLKRIHAWRSCGRWGTGAASCAIPVCRRGDRLRAHVFKIGQHGVVVKQDPAEAGVSGQIFVDVGDLLANPGIQGDRRTYGWRASNAFPVCGSQR